ncbi:MAG: hypothetical protein KDB86_02205 [Actinobacteria bacterium]|nr:hypothetical protein [Actinomycetota bacterium]MCB9388849.1 hypothetical protein [Acidimicrobiia bacterium]
MTFSTIPEVGLPSRWRDVSAGWPPPGLTTALLSTTALALATLALAALFDGSLTRWQA